MVQLQVVATLNILGLDPADSSIHKDPLQPSAFKDTLLDVYSRLGMSWYRERITSELGP